jgi:signal transduction histidine kinase
VHTKAAPARRLLLLSAALLAAGILWTALIVAIPNLGFNLELPRTRIALDTATITVAVMTAAVAFVRASVTGPVGWWYVASAFLLLGLNRLLFGVIIPEDTVDHSVSFYLWTTGRVMAAALLLMAGFRRFRLPGRRAPFGRGLLTTTLPTTALMAVMATLVWVYRESLPALSSAGVDPEHVTGVLPGLHPMVLVAGALGTLMFLAAALLHLRAVEGRVLSSWLTPALVVAALGQVHSTLAPVTFGDNVATGELLRFGFSLLLLAGIVHDVRTAYARERERALQLQTAFLAERARVEDMEALERAKEEFFEVLTHELMHPVAALRGVALTLETRWKDLDDATKREFVGQLVRESGRLRDLAEDSTAAVHVEGEQFSIAKRREPVADLVREISEASQEVAGRLRIRVDDDLRDASVVADRTRVLQVMRNLLSNAAKYSDAGDPIQLRVSRVDGEVSFTVTDQGPGIPKEITSRLFQRFARFRIPGKETVPGSGLGLYISRRIVEAHGGRMWLASTAGAGAGASVTFTLPHGEGHP